MKVTIKKKDITVKLVSLKGIHFVYSLFDCDKLVYIGCSRNVYKRFKEHCYQKQFTRIEMFSMPDNRSAKIKEKELIQLHKPGLNGNGFVNRPVIFNDDRLNRINTDPSDLLAIHRSIIKR